MDSIVGKSFSSIYSTTNTTLGAVVACMLATESPCYFEKNYHSNITHLSIYFIKSKNAELSIVKLSGHIKCVGFINLGLSHWLGGSVVKRRSLIGELSLVCIGPAADG